MLVRHSKKKNFSRSCTIRCLCLSCLGLVHRSSPFCSKNGISLVELSRSKIVLRDFKMIPWELCLKYKKKQKREKVHILQDSKVSCEFLNNPIVSYKFPANPLFYFISFLSFNIQKLSQNSYFSWKYLSFWRCLGKWLPSTPSPFLYFNLIR